MGVVALEFAAMADDFPDTMEDFAQDALFTMTEIPRKYIPARHRKQALQRTTKTATGRLWSSWGRRDAVRTDNPDSSEFDNVAEITKEGDTFKIAVGTNVHYAAYVNEGRPFGSNRPEYLFSERGTDEIEQELEDRMSLHMDRLIGKEKTSATLSRLARTQGRSVSGRFTEELFR